MRIDAQRKLLGREEVYVSGVYAQGPSRFAVFPDGDLLRITAPPPVRTTPINVLTNFPRVPEERLTR